MPIGNICESLFISATEQNISSQMLYRRNQERNENQELSPIEVNVNQGKLEEIEAKIQTKDGVLLLKSTGSAEPSHTTTDRRQNSQKRLPATKTEHSEHL